MRQGPCISSQALIDSFATAAPVRRVVRIATRSASPQGCKTNCPHWSLRRVHGVGGLPVLVPRGALVIVTGLRRTERHRGQWTYKSTMLSLFEAPGAANGEPGQSCSCSPCCSDRGKGRSGQAGAPESRMDEYCNWSRERAACQIPTISVCNPCNYAGKSWVLHLRKTCYCRSIAQSVKTAHVFLFGCIFFLYK